MRAVYIEAFGDRSQITVTDVPDPAPPGPTEVLVEVKAAGLNRADLLQAAGKYPPPAAYSPNIPGLEFAGVVRSVGAQVTLWHQGDRVFGITAGEAQAEYLVTDQSLLAAIPERLEFTDAAAVPEAFITAHDALVTTAGLERGETVLIHAVGSGVGLAALQIAKSMGCSAIGTSRTVSKLEQCKDIGLDHGLLVEDANFSDRVIAATEGLGANVILDLVGGAYFESNLRSLAHKGRLILVGLTAGTRAQFDLGMALSKRARIIGTVLRSRSIAEKAEATKGLVRDILPLLADGMLEPTVDRIFSVDEVAAAHAYLRSNESFGKVVLEF